MFFVCRALNYLDIDSPIPAGNKAFLLTPISGHSANTTPADSHLLQIYLECLSSGLTWTSSSLASVTNPLHKLAGLNTKYVRRDDAFVCTGGDVAVTRKEKPCTHSKSAETDALAAEASWQQVLEYNTSRNAAVKQRDTATFLDSGTSNDVITNSRCESRNSLSIVPLSGDEEPLLIEDGPACANDSDGHHSSLHAVSHSKHEKSLLGSGGLATKCHSAQDVSRQLEVSSTRHGSTESLLKDRQAGTLPLIDRLQRDAAVGLSRRQSFSGTMHKAATAVVVGCRGLRDSLKAISADLLTSAGSGGGRDDMVTKSSKVPSTDNLGQQIALQLVRKF